MILVLLARLGLTTPRLCSKNLNVSQSMSGNLGKLQHVATLPTRRRRDIYIRMLIENDQSVDLYYVILSKVFSWTLLAGYIVLPSTFTTVNRSETFKTMLNNEPVLEAFQNPPLLVLASVLFFMSLAGLTYIWWVWKRNYIWSLNNIITYVYQRNTMCRHV